VKGQIKMDAPKYLEGYRELWQKSPREANVEWFKNAKWGLFVHYGLYSQLGRGEWALFREEIPINEYEKLFNTFDPKNFDADYITDLALEAEMSYVNFTTCHHEGFCLWNSSVEMYNSYTAVKRDLTRELAEQCDKKGLGFFAYYTHVLNWHHQYPMPGNAFFTKTLQYDKSDSDFVYRGFGSVDEYWQYVHACMEEILDFDFPLAGIWLDIIAAYYDNPAMVRIEDTYELIRSKRPDILLSFKQGATGTEDFAAPEFHFASLAERYRKEGREDASIISARVWNINKQKHNEICMTLQETNWGYQKDASHYNAEEVYSRLGYAMMNNCNMLANTGPLPDGLIHSDDDKTLREVGRMIRENGWPTPKDAYDPNAEKELKGGAMAV
jgi:alpha-L-fucosidase